jgi:hypothetical protein
MAENFMVQHSLLREIGHLTDASEVIYNFDKKAFVSQLNGVTELMVLLGTLQPPVDSFKVNSNNDVVGANRVPANSSIIHSIGGGSSKSTKTTKKTNTQQQQQQRPTHQDGKDTTTGIPINRAHFTYTTIPLAKASIAGGSSKRVAIGDADNKNVVPSQRRILSSSSSIRGSLRPISLSYGDTFLLPRSAVAVSTTEVFKPLSSPSSTSSGTVRNGIKTNGTGTGTMKNSNEAVGAAVPLGGPKLNGVQKKGHLDLSASTAAGMCTKHMI